MMIYHANCADGFGAAWAAWMRWGDALEYVPCAYGQEPPEMIDGRNILIGDFSFKAPVLAEMASRAASIVILDHHLTAQADLAKYRNYVDRPERFTRRAITGLIEDLQRSAYPAVCALFDMERSGAVMTWEFCFPGQPVPLLLRLIEDRDLWRHARPESKPFGAWLRCEPFDFEGWDLISQDLEDGRGFTRIMNEALAVQRFYDQKVLEIAALAHRAIIGGFDVPVCNCPYMFASEVGHALLAKDEAAPFAALYSDGQTSRSWSLRSEDHRVDVSEIARAFGGGGHRNAAGFSTARPRMEGLIHG
jgi:oligoribonuclease NrnB/cAMP/cGMP phosphodiesterase (DHH superfamily)